MNANKMNDKEYIEFLLNKIDELEADLENESECKREAMDSCARLLRELEIEKVKRMELEDLIKKLVK